MQERLKKTNKLVKKPARSSGAGDAGKEGTPLDGSASKADKSATGLKALLRGLSGKSNTSNGGTKDTVSHSGRSAKVDSAVSVSHLMCHSCLPLAPQLFKGMIWGDWHAYVSLSQQLRLCPEVLLTWLTGRTASQPWRLYGGGLSCVWAGCRQ